MSGESASSKAAAEYNNAKRLLNKALHTDDTGWHLHFVFAIAILLNKFIFLGGLHAAFASFEKSQHYLNEVMV